MNKILNDNYKELLKKYKLYSKFCKSIDNKEELYNLIGYMASLRTMINEIKMLPVFETSTMIKNSTSYNKCAADFTLKMVNDFFDKKDFHKKMFDDIVPNMENELDLISFNSTDNYEIINPNEFLDILYQFAESYKVETYFKDMIENKKIYIGKKRKVYSEAYSLYDPIEKKSSILIKNFKCDLNNQRKICHELGHVIDFSKLDSIKVNEYVLRSFYIEVLSITFERLFLRYIRKNNISNDVNKLYSNFLEIRHDYIFLALLFASFDKEFLKEDNGYGINSTPEEIVNNIDLNYEIYRKEEIMKFIRLVDNFDLRETFIYTYGDIISLTLVDHIEKEGLDCEMYRELNKIRLQEFDIPFMNKYEINSKKYINRLHNEMKILQNKINVL